MLIALCCVVGCPLLMAGMMFLMRDREGPRLEREIRRLNAQAARRRETIAAEVGITAESQPVWRANSDQAQPVG